MLEPSYGFWSVHNRSPGMPGPHAHLDLEWNYLLRGRFAYRMAGQELALAPRRLTLFWAGVPHQSLSAGAEVIVGVMPLARFLAWQPPGGALRRLLAGELLAAALDRHGDDERLLDRWCAEMRGAAGARRELLEWEVRARCQRLLLDGNHAGGQALSPGVASLLEALAAGHRQHGGSGRFCAALGYHPKRLGTDFRRQIGISPGRLLMHLRLAEAQRLLRQEPDLNLAGVARRSGYGSLASFHASFRQATGTSPVAWRQALDSGHVGEADGAVSP